MPQPAEIRQPPLVAVIVVSWNAQEDTLACLDSAEISTHPNLRLVVVDNASTDGSLEAIRGRFPRAVLIALADNHCFTYAANRGIEAARHLGAAYYLLLNNDAILENTCLAKLVAVAEADPAIGVLCPKVLFMDDRTRIQYAGGQMSLVTGRSRARGFGERDKGQFDDPAEVEFASGCCALIRRETVDKVGPLEESYYHGYEDIDFCLRAREAGHRVVYRPDARVWHKLAASSGGYDSPFYVYYQIRNRFLLMRKHSTAWQALSSLPFQVAHVARRAGELVLARRWASLPAIARGCADAAAGLTGRSPCYPTPVRADVASPAGPPTVLIVNPVGVEAGGVQRILLELFRELAPKNRYRFVVAVPRIGRYEEEYLKLGVRVYAFPVSIIRRSLNPLTIARMAILLAPNVLRLRNIIRSHGVALVHTQKMNTLAGDLAARFSGVPSIHSLHEIPLKPRWLYQTLGAMIYRLADRVVVTCQSSREMIPRIAAGDPRVTTIYNGFDLSQVRDADRPGEIRHELGVPEGMPLIGTGGRLSPSKGYEIFLEAAKQMLGSGTRAKFLIIGDIIDVEDAPYKEKIYRRVKEPDLENHVILTGFRKDYHSVIAAMDVFVLPSLYDTLPLMVIEAMALGRPIVASAVGGVPEQVVDQQTGLLVRAGDSQALAAAISRLLADPESARTMGREGRRRAEEVFSIHSYAEATCRIYDEMLDRRGEPE